MSLRKKDKTISIIGAGKTGSALAIELYSAGYKIGCIVDHKKRHASRIAGLVKAERFVTSVDVDCIRSSGLIIISVKDDVLLKVAEDISRFSKISADTLLVHTSGVHSSDALVNSGFKKINIASFHPVQTFMDISYSNRSLLSGIYFGVEGGINAKNYLKSICRNLNSYYFVIDKKAKPMYHLACVIASNFLVADFGLISIMAKFMNLNGYKIIRSLIPLAESTLQNIKKTGPVRAMTGPIVRNDIGTIIRHLNLIKSKLPEFKKQYTAVSSVLADMAEKGNNITAEEKNVIIKILKRF